MTRPQPPDAAFADYFHHCEATFWEAVRQSDDSTHFSEFSVQVVAADINPEIRRLLIALLTAFNETGCGKKEWWLWLAATAFRFHSEQNNVDAWKQSLVRLSGSNPKPPNKKKLQKELKGFRDHLSEASQAAKHLGTLRLGFDRKENSSYENEFTNLISSLVRDFPEFKNGGMLFLDDSPHRSDALSLVLIYAVQLDEMAKAVDRAIDATQPLKLMPGGPRSRVPGLSDLAASLGAVWRLLTGTAPTFNNQPAMPVLVRDAEARLVSTIGLKEVENRFSYRDEDSPFTHFVGTVLAAHGQEAPSQLELKNAFTALPRQLER